MAEQVNVKLGDNRSEVAYKMAERLWLRTHDKRMPSDDTEIDEFLTLVARCVYALKD